MGFLNGGRFAAQVAAWWAALTVGPSKITMATGKLLGRSTAGSGGAEEITVGSGLSLSGGTLSASGGGLPTGVTSPGDGALNFATGTLTASRPSINVSQTWNASGTTFHAIDVQITDTASATASAPLRVRGGSAGTTDLLLLTGGGSLKLTSTVGVTRALQSATNSLRILNSGETAWSTLTVGSLGIDSAGALKFGLFGGESADTGIARNEAGVVEINNGTAGAFRDLRLRNLIATQVVQTQALTVATLPAAASWPGGEAYVTDASSPTIGSTVAGGGSARAVVRSNGTDWIVTSVI